MANLIRNPNSPNLFYVPPEDFPVSTGYLSIRLNDDGSFQWSAASQISKSFEITAELEEELVYNKKYYFVLGYNFSVMRLRFYSGNSSSGSSYLGSGSDRDGQTSSGQNYWSFTAPTGGINKIEFSGSTTAIAINGGKRLEVSLVSEDDFDTSYEFTSAYMIAPTSYTKQFFYQNSDGTWPTTPQSQEVIDNVDSGTSVNLSYYDKLPTLSSDVGEYIYDPSRSVESAIVQDDGSTVLKAYFKTSGIESDSLVVSLGQFKEFDDFMKSGADNLSLLNNISYATIGQALHTIRGTESSQEAGGTPITLKQFRIMSASIAGNK